MFPKVDEFLIEQIIDRMLSHRLLVLASILLFSSPVLPQFNKGFRPFGSSFRTRGGTQRKVGIHYHIFNI